MSDKKGEDATGMLDGVQAEGKAGRIAAKGEVHKNPRKGRRKFGFESIKGHEFSADG